MLPSATDIGYFVEIAGTRNISRASERLGISQPSLSLAMRRLEDAVGAPLLIRNKRGVTLTRAGSQLLAHSARLLQSWEEIRSEAIASMNEIQGSYTIGAHPSVALYLLSGFLPRLMAEQPKLDIHLKHDLSRKVAEDVISLKTDIGVVVNPVQHPDLIIHKLCEDEVTLWTAAGKQSPTQKFSVGRAVLICDPDLVQAQSLMKDFKKRGMVFDRTVTTNNLEVITELTANGCGLGILPAKVAKRSLKPLKRVPKAPVFHDEHCLIYRVENRDVKSIQALRDAIRDSVRRGA